MTDKPTRRAPYATIIAIVAVAAYYSINDASIPAPTAPAAQFDERFDGAMIESSGLVARLLSDDTDGARHQRFVLLLDGGQTLLVAHNIDLAARIEGLKRGDTVKFRGRYENNNLGGVVHWTHHDPRGEGSGGWLEHEGRRYQ